MAVPVPGRAEQPQGVGHAGIPQALLDPQQSLRALLLHRRLRGGVEGHHVLGEGHLALGQDRVTLCPANTPRTPRGAGPFPGTSRQAWSCGANPSHSCSSSAALGRAGAAGARSFFFLRTRLLWGGNDGLRRGCPTPRDPQGGAATSHLHHEVGTAAAEALQHAEEEVGRLHQVPQEAARLLGLVELAEEREEELPVFHQVEDVAWGGGEGQWEGVGQGSPPRDGWRDGGTHS